MGVQNSCLFVFNQFSDHPLFTSRMLTQYETSCCIQKREGCAWLVLLLWNGGGFNLCSLTSLLFDLPFSSLPTSLSQLYFSPLWKELFKCLERFVFLWNISWRSSSKRSPVIILVNSHSSLLCFQGASSTLIMPF